MSYGFVKDLFRPVLEAVADEMIPSFGEMPSVSQAEVVSVWAEEVLNLRQDLREPFFRALRQLQQTEALSPHDNLTLLQRQDADAFHALGTVLSGGYYLNPDVHRKIGYSGQVSRVNYDADENPEYLRDGLLEPVIRRGPVFRSV